MKKILTRAAACLLALLMAFACASCLESPENPPATEPDPAEMSANDIYYPDVVYNPTFTNVKDFNAKGDGETDDTEAVRAGIAALKDKGGTLFFPEGTYNVKSATFPANVCVAFERGAMLNSKGSVVINSYLYAGNYRVFTGDGAPRGTFLNDYGNPVWFGAVGDGETDSTKAFVRTATYFRHTLIPDSEKGYVVSAITFSGPTRFSGVPMENKRVKIIASAETADLMTVAAGEVTLENLFLDMSRTKQGSCAIYFNTSARTIEKCYVRNIETEGAYTAVRDAKHASNMVITTVLDEFLCRNNRGTAFVMEDFWGFIFLRNSVVDNRKTLETYGVEPNFPGVSLKDNAGCIFQNVSFFGSGNESNTREHGFAYINNVATWMEACKFDGLGGNAVNVTGNNSHLYMTNLTVTNAINTALQIGNTSMLQMHGIKISGAENITKGSGILFSGVNFSQVTDCTIEGMHDHGISVGGKNNSFVNNTLTNNGGNAVKETSGSANTFVGTVMSGNGSDTVSLTGSASGSK